MFFFSIHEIPFSIMLRWLLRHHSHLQKISYVFIWNFLIPRYSLTRRDYIACPYEHDICLMQIFIIVFVTYMSREKVNPSSLHADISRLLRVTSRLIIEITSTIN